MPSKRTKSFASQEQQIKRALAKQVEKNIDTILRREFEQMEDFLEKQYNRTTANWEGRSDSLIAGPIHAKPSPEIEYSHLKVDDNLKVSFRIHSWMADPSGKPSRLWIWIDRGADYTMPVKSAPFRWRAGRRTRTGGLDPGPHPGYRVDSDGNEIKTVLPAGWQVIHPGTGWTNMIGQEFKSRFSGKLDAQIRFRSIGRRTY